MTAAEGAPALTPDQELALDMAALIGDYVAGELGGDVAELRRLAETASISAADRVALAEAVDPALDTLAGEPAFTEIVTNAKLAAERHALGGLSDVALNYPDVLALVTLIVLPGLRARFNLGRYGEIEIKPDFPASLRALGEAAAKIVAAWKGKAPASETPKGKQPTGGDDTPEGGGRVEPASPKPTDGPGGAEASAGDKTRMARAPAVHIKGDNPWERLRPLVAEFVTGLSPGEEECVAIRDTLFAALNEKTFLQDLRGSLGAKPFTGKPEDREAKHARDRIWRQPWAFADAGHDPVFGVGLVRGKGETGTNLDTWSVTLRVIGRHMFSQKSVKRMADGLRAVGGARIGLRVMTQAVCAGSNPMGDYLPWWVRPTKGQFETGLPLAVSAGRPASAGWLIRDAGHNFVLTAGHALADGGREGSRVYMPPQPTTPDPKAAFGLLHAKGDFPKFTLDGGLPNKRGIDHAWVRLDSTIGTPAQRVVNQAIAGTPPKEFSFFGAEIVKAAGKSRDVRGRVVGVNLLLPYTDRVTGHAVRGDRFVEIELEQDETVMDGDSGSLLCLADGMVPMGMMVAAARSTRLTGPASRVAVYGVLLADIPPPPPVREER